jgi:hypothetical protein
VNAVPSLTAVKIPAQALYSASHSRIVILVSLTVSTAKGRISEDRGGAGDEVTGSAVDAGDSDVVPVADYPRSYETPLRIL